MGWTQTQDAGMSYRLVDLLRTIHQEGNMTHRVYVAVPVSEAMERFKQGREKTMMISSMSEASRCLLMAHSVLAAQRSSTTTPIAIQRLHGQNTKINTHADSSSGTHRRRTDRNARYRRSRCSLLDWYDEAFTATLGLNGLAMTYAGASNMRRLFNRVIKIALSHWGFCHLCSLVTGSATLISLQPDWVPIGCNMPTLKDSSIKD